MNTKKITRFEVIDDSGRVYTKWDCAVVASVQDDGRTLKIFVTPRVPGEDPTR